MGAGTTCRPFFPHMSKRKHKLEILPIEQSTGEHSTLLAQLESEGRVQRTTTVQLYKARHLFLARNPVALIAKKMNLQVSQIEYWVMAFGWQEILEKKQFAVFQKVSGLRDQFSPNTEKRHDRLAGTIESCAERLLQAHQDGDEVLTTKDLQTLAGTVKTTMDIRRTVRGQGGPSSKAEVNVTHSLNMPASMDRLANALSDAAVPTRELNIIDDAPPRRLEVAFGETIGNDEEFEAEEAEGE